MLRKNKQQEFKLSDKERAVYRLLETDMNKWFSKEEIIDALPEYFDVGDATSHDICSTLNLVRLRINRVCGIDGSVSHYVVLKNNHFKIANEEELKEELDKISNNLWKQYLRYLRAKNVLKYNEQGKLFDCNGNPIDEDSLAKRFFEPFNFE